MREELHRVDRSVLDTAGVDEAWDCIKLKIIQLMEQNIPKVKVKCNEKPKPIWFNKSVWRIIKKKYYVFKRFLETKSGKDYLHYIEIRNKTNKEIRKASRENEKSIAKECKSNPKSFWKYVRTKTKAKTGLSPLRKRNGDIALTDNEKADTLNEYFTSVFTKENLDNLPPVKEAIWSEGKTLTEILVTPKAVENKLKQLDVNKAQGPDNIPPIILKELSKELSVPLSILFNKSIEKGIVPRDWKVANVIALFKKGNKSEPGNYRPVSLTSVICKVFESIIREVIVDYMSTNNLYTEWQHGFRKHRSCITQLLQVMEDFTKLLDEGDNIDVIYLD